MVSPTSLPLYIRDRDPVPIVQEDGWASPPVWTSKENLTPTRVRNPDRPARSESLYRLEYLTKYAFSPECTIFKKPEHNRAQVSYILGRIIVGFRMHGKLKCTLKEELKLEVFDEIALKRTFGSETVEVKGG